MNINFIWRSVPAAVIESSRVDVKPAMREAGVVWTVALWWEVDPFDHRIVAYVECETEEQATHVAGCIRDVLLTMREEQ